MNDTIALILLGLVLFVVQTKYSHGNRDLADLARRNAWLAWKMMHPELFTPGSKGDRLDRAFLASTTSQSTARQPAAAVRHKLGAAARQLLLLLP
jgi:hypothetical protein